MRAAGLQGAVTERGTVIEGRWSAWGPSLRIEGRWPAWGPSLLSDLVHCVGAGRWFWMRGLRYSSPKRRGWS